jgi:hypothetical protein
VNFHWTTPDFGVPMCHTPLRAILRHWRRWYAP